MNNQKNEAADFKPYIPADRVLPEITVTSVLLGVILAVVFGAANAYLGLRVGMTVFSMVLILLRKVYHSGMLLSCNVHKKNISDL